MKSNLSAPALCAALLCLPVLAQEPPANPVPELFVYHTVVLHSPVPTTLHRVRSLLASQDAKQVLRQALGNATNGQQDLSIVMSSSRAGDAKNGVDRDYQECSSLEFELGCQGKLLRPLPAGKDEEVFDALLVHLQNRLETNLRAIPMARDQQRLAELDDLARKLEAEHMDLRQRLLALSTHDSSNTAAVILDLDKKRLDVELDLRTEEAAQERLQKMAQETQVQQQDLEAKAGALQREVNHLSRQAKGGVPLPKDAKPEDVQRASQQLDDLTRQSEDLTQAFSKVTAESKRCAAQLDAIADDARKATLSIHRLSARLSVLQKMIAEQQKLAEQAQAAAFERESVLARADERKARMTALRQRAEEIRARLDAIEPVRLEVWK